MDVTLVNYSLNDRRHPQSDNYIYIYIYINIYIFILTTEFSEILKSQSDHI